MKRRMMEFAPIIDGDTILYLKGNEYKDKIKAERQIENKDVAIKMKMA